ncbi:MAG: FGGY-family carbohydrate kinase [Hyphomicrobiales bacterium]
MRDLVIGIDSSTSSTKAIAFDRNGKVIAEGRTSISISNPRPLWFEQKVEDWIIALNKSLNLIFKKISSERIAAIAISNQRETFAQFDIKNKPLRPGSLWLDERSHAEVTLLSQELGEKKIHQITGKPPDVTPCLYRCRWFSANEPNMWDKMARTAEVHGVLVHYLTDNWNTSIASADPMGLVDMKHSDWSDLILDAAKLRRSQLPELFRPGEVLGEVTARAAKLTGLRAGTLVVAGGGDGQCAGTGANIFKPGRAYLNLGTAIVSGSYGVKYAIDPAWRTEMAVSEEGYVFETAIRTGTYQIHWMVERLFNVDIKKQRKILQILEKEAEKSPIGAKGLMLVPYWSGCMTPYWDTSARGIIAGLSSYHTRGDVYRALLEAMALEQTMMTNSVDAVTNKIAHYAVVGGGSSSDLWCQIIADASGRDVKRLDTVEASALGAAMAAAKGAKWFSKIAEASQVMSGKPIKTFRPRKKQNLRYTELLKIYTDLWPHLSGWNKRLVKFSRDSVR